MDGPQNLYLARPRGFCAGVKRAIATVEKALAQFGAPVYVRHEIVHNKHIVDDLRKRGVVFIENWSEVVGNRPVIISAHGAAAEVYEEAEKLGLKLIDATCPLVAKVHAQFKKMVREKTEIIVIGKASHPEIIGTAGQVKGYQPVAILGNQQEAQSFKPAAEKRYGVVTQTTLPVDEVTEITNILSQKICGLEMLNRHDICYATTHRQAAVKRLAEKVEGIVIIGSQNSSNSRQLQKTALAAGAKQAWLVDDVGGLDWRAIDQLKSLGISAGASAPDYLADELVDECCRRYPNLKIQDVIVAEEKIDFKIPGDF